MPLFLKHSQLRPLSIPPTTQVFAFARARSWQDPTIPIIPLLLDFPISMPEPKNPITTMGVVATIGAALRVCSDSVGFLLRNLEVLTLI